MSKVVLNREGSYFTLEDLLLGGERNNATIEEDGTCRVTLTTEDGDKTSITKAELLDWMLKNPKKVYLRKTYTPVYKGDVSWDM